MSQDPSLLPRPISHIFFRGCSPESQQELLARMPILEGALLSDELVQTTRKIAKAIDVRLEILVSRALPSEAFLELPEELRNRIRPPAAPDGVNVTIYDPASVPNRIRIEGSVQDSMLLEKVMPLECVRATGDVRLSIVVGKDGTVIEVRPLSGPDSLRNAAVDAVGRWKYRPTLLNGLPVEVLTEVSVSFTPNA